jgi:putative FmdB family regulatory protein
MQAYRTARRFRERERAASGADRTARGVPRHINPRNFGKRRDCGIIFLFESSAFAPFPRGAPQGFAMPIYEYRCSSCGHELESIQKLSDPPLVACPACHKDALVKLVSAAGFQLKGSGWYATDFKGGGKPAPAKSGSDTKPADAKPAESKSETASAAPAATPVATPPAKTGA